MLPVAKSLCSRRRNVFWRIFLSESLLDVTHLVHSLPCWRTSMWPDTDSRPFFNWVIPCVTVPHAKAAVENDTTRCLHFCRSYKTFWSPFALRRTPVSVSVMRSGWWIRSVCKCDRRKDVAFDQQNKTDQFLLFRRSGENECIVARSCPSGHLFAYFISETTHCPAIKLRIESTQKLVGVT